MKITLYHNPQCSKSCESLRILQEETNVQVSIIEYLKTPLTLAELVSIAQKLHLVPRQFMRQNDIIYQSENLANPNLTDSDLLQAIIKHPRLLERPIAVSLNHAVIGRPPEHVLTYCNV